MDREYVGIDLHRRRSVIVRKNAEGELLSKVHIDNDPMALAEAVAAAGPEPEVVLEATFGWYWAADRAGGDGRPCPSGPPVGEQLGEPAGQERRARRHRSGRLVAPGPAGRGVDRPAGGPRAAGDGPLPAQAGPAALRAQGPGPCGDGQARGDPGPVDMFGPGGTAQLDALDLPIGYSTPAGVVARPDRASTTARSSTWTGASPPSWPTTAAIGPSRPSTGSARYWPRCSWPRSATSPGSRPGSVVLVGGMTPRHRESDTKVRRGSITKQGSPAGALGRGRGGIEEPRRRRHQSRLPAHRRAAGPQHRPGRRRPARLLTLVYYGLRDGEIRCLAQADQG